MIEIPIRIESTPNKREHWAAKAKRTKMQREAVQWIAGQAMRSQSDALPQAVRLTRIAPRELDTDNLAAGFKAVRDGVADWLGIKDNDPRVAWQYAQEKGRPHQYACRIEFLAEGAVASLRQLGATQ